MTLDQKWQCLLTRADRALGQHKVSDAMAKVKAIIGPAQIPSSESLAQAALDTLRNGDVPTAEELAALAIVIRLLRPVVYSRDGQLDDIPEVAGHTLHPQEYKDVWSDFRKKVAPLLFSIGRVELADGKHIGTGFLVGTDLLATNRHVLDAMTFGSEVLAPGGARVVFKQEIGSTNPPGQIVQLDGVAAVHPRLDMALLRLPRLERPFVSVEPSPVAEGTQIAAIGYPADDPVNNPLFLAPVFKGRFGVKRAALGEVLDGTESPLLFHDCSTTQGNSGSPIFSLATGRVAGIHRAGFFMYRNEAVDADELRAFIRANTS